MTKENVLLLLVSVILSAGRNIFTKKTATSRHNKSEFYFSQTVLFGSGAMVFLLYLLLNPCKISAITYAYGFIYGILLIASQWLFTLALKNGNVAVCSTVYSFGFILPTVSGTLFWNESFTLQNGIGVILAITVILLAAKKDNGETCGKNTYILFVIIAMISAGGLGIMQKVQGTTGVADEKGAFLLIAFLLAFTASFVAYGLSREKSRVTINAAVSPLVTGLCFGGANFCNTLLAGSMNSIVFFPLQNISTLLATALFGLLIFKEKITIKTITVLLLGVATIVLFSV